MPDFTEFSTDKIGTLTKTGLISWEIYDLRIRAHNRFGEGEWKALETGVGVFGNVVGEFNIDDHDDTNTEGYSKITNVWMENNIVGDYWAEINLWRVVTKRGLIKSYDFNQSEPFVLPYEYSDGTKTVYIELIHENGMSVMFEVSMIIDRVAPVNSEFSASFSDGTFTIDNHSPEADVTEFFISLWSGEGGDWGFLYYRTSGWIPITRYYEFYPGGSICTEYTVLYKDYAGNVASTTIEF